MAAILRLCFLYELHAVLVSAFRKVVKRWKLAGSEEGFQRSLSDLHNPIFLVLYVSTLSTSDRAVEAATHCTKFDMEAVILYHWDRCLCLVWVKFNRVTSCDISLLLLINHQVPSEWVSSRKVAPSVWLLKLQGQTVHLFYKHSSDL